MPYLFESSIKVLNQSKSEVKNLKDKATAVTGKLQTQHPHNNAYTFPDTRAAALAANMGARSRRDRAKETQALTRAGGGATDIQAHVLDYVESSAWIMVSSNAQIIFGLVSGELKNAYDLGIDIRSPAVIGKMYKYAVMTWSLGVYTGFDQDEGKR
jgi:hypothetical protein